MPKAGMRIVSVTVEKSLLRRADAYANAKGIERSERIRLQPVD
jgi:metal-responsive CopG/Arc/MetJ family transcriptional regulator